MARLREITYDLHGEWPAPQNGDILLSSRTRYFVIMVWPVKRRITSAVPRFRLWVLREQDAPVGLDKKLVRRASKRGGRVEYTLSWNKRKKKIRTFEQLMRGGAW